MPDAFANPWGFLGLLAIPAILAIHFLREKSRRVRVSTLFLLDRMQPRTPTGRTIQQLQNSVPLWLQLLIAVLCSWLLVQPQWLRADSRQRVTIVVDPSASMLVARPRILSELPGLLAALGKAAARTEWIVLSAHRPETPLYRGPDAAALQAIFEEWQPMLPSVDPARAFSVALLEARGGPILYFSDRNTATLPGGITLLAFGEPIDNCGFAGVRTWRERDGLHWEALVRNSGSQPQEREWWVETGRDQSQRLKLILQPGEFSTIPGLFPREEKQLRVCLSGDGFALDDILPLVAPEPKPLLVAFQAADVPSRFVERILATVPGAQRVGDSALADVIIGSEDAVQRNPAGKTAIVFGASAGQQPIATAPITTERHPLTEGAVWNGLLGSGAAEVTLTEGDQALVWQSGRPLLYLREREGARQMVLNFDFARSNADRLPAVVLAFSRFLLQAQAEKDAVLVDNFETNQTLPVSAQGALEVVEPSGAKRPNAPGAVLRAPLEPGFFTVLREGEALLTGAARFGDPQEADFRSAQTLAANLDRKRLIPRENLESDRWQGLWLVAVAAALGGSWFVQQRALRS
jgi:hypothetical protein